MFILYYKELHIIKEPLTKNRCHQTWRGKQVAMCEEKGPLQAFIDSQPNPTKYYIEETPNK